jgi:hypothetical protein
MERLCGRFDLRGENADDPLRQAALLTISLALDIPR